MNNYEACYFTITVTYQALIVIYDNLIKINREKVLHRNYNLLVGILKICPTFLVAHIVLHFINQGYKPPFYQHDVFAFITFVKKICFYTYVGCANLLRSQLC